MELIEQQALSVIDEVLSQSSLKKGDLLVIGCSTSEVGGSSMGTDSNFETAKKIFNVIYPALKEKGIYLAAQCCEHLNRAVVVESEYASSHMLEQVSVRPMPKAGGSFATAAYENFDNPVVVENVKANAGIDIGGVLIGMQIKSVAVPLKLKNKHIGKAIVIAARSRPKYIGGERAHYE